MELDTLSSLASQGGLGALAGVALWLLDRSHRARHDTEARLAQTLERVVAANTEALTRLSERIDQLVGVGPRRRAV